MARKVLMTVLALSLALAASAFASGEKEAAPAPGAAAGRPPFAAQAGEKLTLTGTLALDGLWHPVLKSGGKEYVLMVPRYLTANLDVKEGEQVSVEGYTVTGAPRGVEEGDIALFVTKATIKGKEYDLSQSRGPMMGGARGGRNWGPGMRGGRGGNRGGNRGQGPAWGPGCPGCVVPPQQG